MALFFTFLPLSAFAKQKTKNPHSGQSGSTRGAGQKKQKALFTTEKKKPNKAERHSVLEDSGIPKEKWKDYTVEYRLPIGFGGSNDYANIEAVPTAQARIKHKVQKELEARLRKQEISLYDAQRRILNWSEEPIAKENLSGTATRTQ